MTMYANGWVQGSVAPLVEWREIISLDDALPHFEAAGFVPFDPLWPRLDDLDLTQSDQRARLERLLVWADETIRAASV